MREGERTLDRAIDLEPVVEDEQKIPNAQEEPISDFEEITEIHNPQITATPTRCSKKLHEKRGGHSYQSEHILSLTSKRKALHVNLDKGNSIFSFDIRQIKLYWNLHKSVILIWRRVTVVEP